MEDHNATPKASQKKKHQWIITAFIVIILTIATGLAKMTTLHGWPNWAGIGKGESISITTEKDATGNIIKIVETVTPESGKTLWDWLSLLGVPLSLAILGYWLQQQQQKRAEILSKDQQERSEAVFREQRRLAAEAAKEEFLQVYFDKLSSLIVDKIASKVNASSREKGGKQLEEELVSEHKELLDTAVDIIIRGRTLSILRRFKDDGERKGSVIRFLLEARVISQTRLDLSGADLGEADLGGVDLSGVDLSGADLSKADLSGTDLSGANLSGTDLSGINFNKNTTFKGATLDRVNLSGIDLTEIDLSGASFSETKLSGANLSKANLSKANLSKAQFGEVRVRGFGPLCSVSLNNAVNLDRANLSGANLSGVNLSNVNLDGSNLSRADLSGANLSKTNLARTNLSNIRFKDTNFGDALLCLTELPNGINLESNRDCGKLGINPEIDNIRINFKTFLEDSMFQRMD